MKLWSSEQGILILGTKYGLESGPREMGEGLKKVTHQPDSPHLRLELPIASSSNVVVACRSGSPSHVVDDAGKDPCYSPEASGLA